MGYPCRPMIMPPIQDTPYNKSLIIQELIKRGILIHSGMLVNLCYSHSEEDIDKALNAFEDALEKIRSGQVELEGSVVQPAFKRL